MTAKQLPDAYFNRALGELGDTMPALCKAGSIFKSIQRLSTDALVKEMAQVGLDIVSFQWACVDDTYSELKRVVRNAPTQNDRVGPTSDAAETVRRSGHMAAEDWYAEFQKCGDAVDGYFFPSGLREFFDILPEEFRGDFLDSVGALMVHWKVCGEPAPGLIDPVEEIRICGMSPADQDAIPDSTEAI